MSRAAANDAPVLVTGASGLIGARLLCALADRGVVVRALVHRAAPPECGAEIVHGDLRDLEAMRRATAGVRAVVHCAAALDPVPSAEVADAVNHRATVNLALAAAANGAKRFVFVSSQAALGWRDGGLLAEDAAMEPSTDYGRSKRDAERALRSLETSMERVVVRPPTVYGPGERRNFLALTQAVATGVFPVLGRGENRMSYCHLENLVAALIALTSLEPPPPPTLHVADRRPVTLREASRTIARVLGTRTLPGHVPLPLANGLARVCEVAFGVLGRPAPLSRARVRTLTTDCALDTGRAHALGLPLPVDFEDGVRETVADYRRHRLI